MTYLAPPPRRMAAHHSAGDVLARSGPPCCPVCHDAGVIVEMRPFAFATHHGELANMPCPACTEAVALGLDEGAFHPSGSAAAASATARPSQCEDRPSGCEGEQNR